MFYDFSVQILKKVGFDGRYFQRNFICNIADVHGRLFFSPL